MAESLVASPEERTTLVERARGDGSVHLTFGATLIHYWWRPPSYESVVRAGRLGREFAQTKHTGISSISVAAYGITVPTLRAQRAGSRSLSDSQKWLLSNAVVIMGDGIGTQAARTAYRAIQKAVSLRAAPTEIFSTAEAAADWTASYEPTMRAGLAQFHAAWREALPSFCD